MLSKIDKENNQNLVSSREKILPLSPRLNMKHENINQPPSLEYLNKFETVLRIYVAEGILSRVKWDSFWGRLSQACQMRP